MTNEPIINARMKKFRESYGLEGMADGDVFEQFVNSSILTSHQPDAFTADAELLDKICVGGGGDTGIDGIAIKLNGILVKSKEEILDIIQKLKRANIEFIFIQSKYKPSFDSHALNTFIAGVRSFLSNSPSLPINEKIKEVLQLKELLLSDDIVYYWENNPSIRMYYVAMGKWRNDPLHLALAEQGKSDIKALNIYENVDLHFVDSEYLKNILESNENKFTAIIETIAIMELTPVKGVDNSCIALCNGEEFARMLTTEEGVIRKSLFDDNVRDFQGENTVNTEIIDTVIKDPSKFVLLNNGITVVCEDFTSNNRKLKIINPQIANGCQTSHVIFNAKRKNFPINNVPLIVRIISTKDPEISNQIVRGTNRQNIVLDEAFEATKPFHKDLESFFNSYHAEFSERIYYERRSKQYSENPRIKQIQRINLRILTQYFIGMFLNNPHKSFRHESVLLKEFANVVFQETQSKLPYYIACFAFYKLEKLFREKTFYADLKPYKAHLLMMYREFVAGASPSINSEKEIDEYCLKIVAALKDDESTIMKFEEVGKLLKESMTLWEKKLKRSRFAMRDVEDFTEFLIKQSRKPSTTETSSAITEADFVYEGVVVRTIVDRNGKPCGFIRRFPNNIFFHSQQNKTLDFSMLEGKAVSYKVRQNAKVENIYAVDVNRKTRTVGSAS